MDQISEKKTEEDNCSYFMTPGKMKQSTSKIDSVSEFWSEDKY